MKQKRSTINHILKGEKRCSFFADILQVINYVESNEEQYYKEHLEREKEELLQKREARKDAIDKEALE